MIPALETCDLAVGRGGRAVLSGVSLRVARGERLALLGANGSGKTTLLRALAGLDAPLAGEIRWAGGGPPPRAMPVRAARLLFQSQPSSPFTVGALVTLGL